MATSFGALCTDFYINHKLTLKMDLPADREAVMQLFERVRAEVPSLRKFKRFDDELALESPRSEEAHQWMALRRNSIRAGTVNPASMAEARSVHQRILEITPFFLSISPLDVANLEVTFGFDLECKTNQHEVVREALLGQTPLGALCEVEGASPIDVQPIVGLALTERCDVQAIFEVKCRTPARQVRAGRYRTEPISVCLTVKRIGPIDKVDQLKTIFNDLADRAERLATDRVIPHVVNPLNRAIISSA